MADDKKIVKWRTTRKGHKIGINAKGVVVKGHPEVIGKNAADLGESMSSLLERLRRMGSPEARGLAAYELGSKVRNFAGEIAYKLADESEPEGEMAETFPKVKRTGQKAVKAMQEFAKAIFDTEKFVDITPKVRGRLQASMDEAITAAGIGATIDRLVDKADTMAEKLKQSRFMAKDRTKFADALMVGAKKLEDIAGGLREDVIGEASQPRLNKYDPGSLLGWVVYLLEKHGLDDAVDDVKELSRKVSKAWQGRER